MRADVRRGMVLALCAAVLSGVAVFVNSYGVKAFGNATVYTTAKNAVAGLVLLATAGPLLLRRSRRAPDSQPRAPLGRARVAGLTALAVVGGSVPFVLFFEGLARIQSGPVQAQFLNKTLVVWVALFAVIAMRERIGPLQLAAVAVLVIGQAVLAGGVSHLSRMEFGRGELMIVTATLLWAIEVVLAKTLLRSVSFWVVALVRMLGGSVLLIAWLAIRGEGGLLAHLDGSQWSWVLATGALLAAYVATWLAALALAPAVTVTALLVVAVPVTAVVQAAVSHTPLRPQLDGLTLVVLGGALALLDALAVRRAQRVTVAL